MSDVPLNLFTVTTTTNLTAASSTGSTDPAHPVSADNSTLIATGTYEVCGLGDVNTATGNFAYTNDLITGGFRPGAVELSTEILASDLAENFLANPDLVNSVVWAPEVKAAALNYLDTGVQQCIPTDPLVLDLNGDGVKLTSFGESPVLFDIDHDGKKEITGWSSARDGIVVMDLNHNGQIDDIAETMSEYFNGVAGTGGDAGEKKYANGFAALKSLDSNGNNQFDAADTAWSNVNVWVDANHDGKTDAGELKTLTELGITSINLTPASQSGLVNGGNEILATGTFVQNGITQEAQAARFIANPTGNTATVDATGTTVSAEDGQSTYVSSITTGETIDVATKGVKNAYGNSGNDTLTGDAGANWLVGGQGSDSFNAGAGDDMLIIDAADQQQNIHAGDGFDMAQVVGSEGVTLNLAQAEIEVIVGGSGDDVFIGGGRSSVFVRAGDGDDIVIGGAANDALSGENGADLIDGGAGNDLIRGGRGQDQLIGGAGDDLVFGGQEDDRLAGGTGNDVLKGDQGDDTIDGGAGTDIAQFSGSFADYRITKLTDTTWRIVDSKAGRDGADMLTNIEKLNFADVSAVDITLDNPMPVKDVLTIANRVGIKLIKVADLLKNDRDWQGDALHITTISDIKGGTIVGTYNATTKEWTPTLTANGELQFTPTPAYTGVMSFKYKIADGDGTPGATALIAGAGTQAQMRGQVYIKTPDMPTDSLFTDQWYLNDINVLPVWKDYTGKGVTIGQFEPGMPFSTGQEVLDYRNPDLQNQINSNWLANPNGDIPQTFSEHATLVAGVIAAGRNGEGAVGVAYDSSISGYWLSGSDSSSLGKFQNYDVVNNSWGSPTPFNISFGHNFYGGDYAAAVQFGRSGLGTVIVAAGGNTRQQGGNANYDNTGNNRYSIEVGAINAATDISTLSVSQAPFSNPGASILVSAPGSNIASTSRILLSNDGTVFGSDTATALGTSFATPIISGVAALMLEANSNLGYRDVQEILAFSAHKINDPQTIWTNNTAGNWNGGGMHASYDYGFGEVDARAAVRLAETWTSQSTTSNELAVAGASGALNKAIPDGSSQLSSTVAMSTGLEVEHAEVTVNLTHQYAGDLIIKLVSPSGTESILMNRPGKAPGSAATVRGDASFDGSQTLSFTFMTTRDWGEQSGGNWTLSVIDAVTGDTGVLQDWSLKLYGKAADSDNTYVYTNEYASLKASTAARGILNDTNGGKDSLNASAVSGDTSVNLSSGIASLGGAALTIQNSAGMENVFSGDGNDQLTGNGADNLLWGGRGNNTLTGGAGADDFVVIARDGGADVVTDFTASAGDTITLVGFVGKNYSDLLFSQSGANVTVNLGAGQSLLLKNTTLAALSSSQFVFQECFEAPLTYVDSSAGPVMPSVGGVITGDSAANRINGTTQAETILGQDGDDEIHAGAGNDILDGGAGTDKLYGDAGDDVIYLDGDSSGFSLSSTGMAFTGGQAWGGLGNDRFVVRSGSANSFSNIIGDFDLSNPNERIDLSHMGIYSFADLRFGSVTMNNTTMALVKDGSNNVLAALLGYTTNQLSSKNFIFADPPVTSGGVGDSGSTLSETTVSGNTLTGDAGGTVLDGGLGAQVMTGRTGDDTYIVDNVGDTVNELPDGGFDTVKSSVSYTLSANVENLVLTGAEAISGTGNDQANRIVGNTADNVLDGKGGVDTMLGGAGNDTYTVDSQADSVIEHAGEGTDTVQSSVSYVLGTDIENLTLIGTADINATGNSLANTLSGNVGDNILDGVAGADTMKGGAGSDIYIVSDVGDVVVENVNEGIDTVFSSLNYLLAANVENLVLSAGVISGTGNELDNYLFGNAAANTLTGGAGNDILNGRAGNDTMRGGIGNDAYVVDSVSDVVTENANEGTDLIYSSVNLTLVNNVENLTLTGISALNATGNAQNNVLTGNSAANTLSGGVGMDTMIGGGGNDTYVVDNAADVITEALNDGADLVQSGVTYTLSANVENLILTGTAAINGTGNAQDNVLTGNTAANILTGGAGNDKLSGGVGADRMIGGTGNDTYVVDNAADVVTEALNEGTDLVQSGIAYTLLANVENLTLTGAAAINGTGNAQDNVLIGNAANNILNGGAGNDTINGGAGNDTMVGGIGDDVYVVNVATDVITEAANAGNDTIQSAVTLTLVSNVENLLFTGTTAINGTGNTLDNTLTGNVAANTLSGGAGIDTMIGGGGNDTYVVDNTADVVTEALNDGTDLALSGVTYTLSANVENLTLTGTAAINGTGNAQDNVLTGNTAANTLSGGTGNDTYVVNNTADTVIEALDEGADLVQSSVTYTLSSNVENLKLTGTAAINGTGNAQDNVLTGNAAANILIGGAGNDTYVVDNATDVVTEVLNEGTDLVQSSVTYTLLVNIENLTLTGAAAINGTGNAQDNVLIGNAANNILNGGAGNDTIDGGAGSDTMVGGLGDDVYVVNVATDVVTEAANAGNDTIQSAVTLTLVSNVENLLLTGTTTINGTGNTLNNTLTGNVAANTLSGGAGTDTMIGGGGNDTYVVDNAVDVVTEALNDGTDLVQSGVTYTLSDNVENLTLTGTAAINGTGNARDNVLIGNAANNILNGGAGNDTINGGAGNDTMVGGIGDDVYIVNVATDVVTEAANAGNDTIQSAVTLTLISNVENLLLTGTTAINGTGNTLDNTLTGNSAANTLSGGAGIDTMIGGGGNDTYIVDNTADVVTEALNEGTDLVQSGVTYTLSANVENLTLTGTAAINGTGNALDNVLNGNAANNILDGGAGSDTMVGGLGDDVYVVNVATDVITEAANAGNDTIQSAVTLTLVSNVENLLLTGTTTINGTGNTLNNTLTGNSAANTLSGGAGIDTMIGGGGNDTYVVDNAADVVTEALNDGTDLVQSGVTYTLSANVEYLTLTGAAAINGTGNAQGNLLTGNAAVNTLTGGAGNDMLSGGAGIDTMIGGVGNDTYVVDNAADVVTEALNEGTDLVQSGVTYTLSDNVENLILTGTATINGTGNALDNVLFGNAANNILNGGAGNDTINGGAGNDTMVGGLGDDVYVVNVATDVVTEAANAGNDMIQSAVTLALVSNVENLRLTGVTAINGTGNTLNNLVRGNEADNTLNGGAGNDILEGDYGNDVLTDTSGTALFNGGIGNDIITGGAGAEVYLGGAGNDTYTTGAGNDIILFNKGGGQDTFAAGGTGNDTLSLGGGIDYADLSFSKSANDLVLNIGTGDQITFKDWYAGTTSKPVANLQVIADAMADFAAGGADPLRDQQVENFNFAGLVGAFDTARTANPGLTSWALTDGLSSFQLAGSDSAALGGDLAYQYGHNGFFPGIGVTAALDILSNGSLGSNAQTLTPLAGLQTGTARLS